MFITLKRTLYKEESTFILLKLLLKVLRLIISNSLYMLRVNMTTSLNLTLEKKYLKHLSISTIRRITLTFQYTEFLTGLETMLLLKRISRRELKLTLMNNSDFEKKIFTKKAFSQHICRVNKQPITTTLQAPLNHSMRLMHSIKKLEQLVQTLCSREKQMKRKVN